MKFCKRYSMDSLSVSGQEDQTGSIFMAHDGALHDLSMVNIVGAFVDTVRQLFTGIPNQVMIERLNNELENRVEIITLDNSSNNKKFHISKMGKNSGYRYKLQNNELGLIILFGSYYKDLQQDGSHLKFELSPHFIQQNGTQDLWDILAGKAGLVHYFLYDADPSGVAVHLAADYQGYDLPCNFLQNFKTYSRSIKTFDGLSEVHMDGIATAICSYGSEEKNKNFLIGKATSMQLCLYDKGREIVVSDKVDYYKHEWSVFSMGSYDETLPVRRAELRLYHEVVRQIGRGMDLNFNAFPDIVPYLTDLWRYGISRNRLDIDQNEHVNPFWQMLIQDVTFLHPAQGITVVRKKKQGIASIEKNLTQILGNMISIFARQGYTAKQLHSQLKILHFYPMLKAYYKQRGKGEKDIYEYLELQLEKRRLIGKAA